MKKILLVRIIIIIILSLAISSGINAESNNKKGEDAVKGTAGIDSLNMKVMVPAYFGASGNYWARMDSQAVKMPGRLWAIINVYNGPGTQYDASYGSAITNLQEDSGKVIGYVHSSYGARSIAEVETDIDTWYALYPSLNGIFIDEQANVSGQEPYYEQLYNYIKQKDSTALVVTNPGANTIPSYLFYNGKRIADVICIYETSPGFETWIPSSWCKNYSRDNFYVITYNTSVSQYVSRSSRAALLNIGWIYCTNDNLPNPYDTLPPYFENFCEFLITGVNPVSNSKSLISIDGNFNDWQNVLPLNPPPVVGDSPDPNADFSNFWSINDTSSLYLNYQLAGTFSTDYFYHVFIDVDTSVNTGFVYNDSAAIGAEFLVENDNLFKYSGTGGSNWAWTQVSDFSKADVGGRAEMSIPLKVLFPTKVDSSIRLLFEINSSGRYTVMDVDPINYKTQYYTYKLTSIVATSVDINIPKNINFKLSQNYPNPFNPSTLISYQIPHAGLVTLKIYNIIGQKVATLVDKVYPAGKYTVTFNLSNGRFELPSGIYFYQLKTGNYVETKKMVLLK